MIKSFKQGGKNTHGIPHFHLHLLLWCSISMTDHSYYAAQLHPSEEEKKSFWCNIIIGHLRVDTLKIYECIRPKKIKNQVERWILVSSQMARYKCSMWYVHGAWCSGYNRNVLCLCRYGPRDLELRSQLPHHNISERKNKPNSFCCAILQLYVNMFEIQRFWIFIWW